MDMKDMREEIGKIDNELIKLVSSRMKKCGEIADYKQKNGMPLYDGGYVQEKLKDIMENTDETMRSYVYMMYSFMFDISRSYEESLIHPSTALMNKITNAIENSY